MANLSDVATRAGVSIRTVRRVLYEPGLVGTKTMARVSAVLEETGYVPNPYARALVGGKSNAVALVVPQLTWYVTNILALTLQQRIADLDLHTVSFVSSGADVAQTVTEIRQLSPQAVILMQVTWQDAYRQLAEEGTPLLGLDVRPAFPEDVMGDAVGIDRVRAFRTTTEHLLQLGHRRVGLLDSHGAAGRQAGYGAAMAAAGLDFRAIAVADATGAQAPDIRTSLERLLGDHPDLTGLVCTTDLWAQEAIHHLAEMGFSVPGDLSVTGYSNEPWTRWTTPSLTTLDQGTGLLCDSAMELMQRRLEDSDEPWSRRIIQPELVPRASTAPPRS